MTAFNRPSTHHAAVFAIVAAYNEADRIAATIVALTEAFPGMPVWVADDGSSDGTAALAQAAGATVVRSERTIGKGAAVTLAARASLASMGESESVALICDGDLGSTAVRLGPLVQAVRCGDGDLAVAVFSKRVGGGLGLAVGFAGWAIRRRCGLTPRAPICGQRALRASTLARLLPFAPGYGMEVAMTIDAVRAGHRVVEIELDLAHRATARTLGGFLHRGRQLIDFLRVYVTRR